MAQWALPLSDVTDGGWTNETGGTTLAASVGEPAASINDLTYIQTTAAPSLDTCLVQLSPIVTPASGTITISVRGMWGIAVAFTWDVVPTATSYVLQVGPASLTYTTYNANVGNVLVYTLLLAPGTYWSRVVSYVGANPLTATGEQQVVVT